MFHRLTMTFLVICSIVAILSAQDMTEPIEPMISVSEVLWLDDMNPIDGAEAILTRMEHGLSVTMTSADLKPGHVYSLWWVIMDVPENCTDNNCSFDDVFLMDDDGRYILDDNGQRQANSLQRESAVISNLSGMGTIGLDNGKAVFRAHLPIGDLSGDNLFGPGLHNPMTAEVHIIIRDHGPASPDPEILAEQLMEPWGGCPDPLDRSPCEDIQVVFFHPPSS